VTVSSSNCTGSTVTDLTHDTFNRLAQVAKTSISTESYKYDDQGNRIQKTVGGTITNFLYNGPDVIGQYTSTWGTASAILTHGPGMDDPIVRTAGTTTQYFHQDGLGSVVSVTNQSGTTDGTARYDAWGNKIASTGTIPQYGYTGREPDDTGLVYYRARFYDPSIGRFTQTDPIGMRGGMNLYAYVNGNPTNFNDPMGLIASSPTNSVNVGSNGEVTVNEISYASNNNSGITSACQCMGEQYAAASTGVSLSDAGNGAGPKYTIDANGAASIASYETFKDHVYDDGYGNFTIGIGHKVLAGETFPAKITQEYALQLFQKDVNKIVQPGLDKITVPLQQHQINALGSLIFNIGTPQFLASSVYTQLQAQNYDQVPSRMLLYDLAYNAILQQKQYSQGLHNRRIVEGLEFMGYGFNFP
jgi:RHS repeat-associated protein